MSYVGALIWLLGPALFLLALIAGLVVFLVVRKRERAKREEFQRRARRQSQEKELEKMKLDDL